MGELANCPKCGSLFVKTRLRSICDACYQEEEKAFETVYNFLRKKENRRSTITEVVQKTGVEEDLILKFIHQGRIQLANFPNLGYPCSRCGTLIREGKLCVSCKKEIQSQIEQMEREEQFQEEKEKMQTYYAIQPKNNEKR
ncbi:TIGR03826 family flagellar region protein [Aeribacillus sp. FSL K6-1121]|jgi:flagellar operon protein (TIGR03826 family)|uniref:TIGR03826 family flagellar region protein n=1 Tax=Aeribacillus TaxID=1055323 RepID=UPI001398F403|nr:hypothetical protein [Aeribacillus composti]MED0746631.1 hypothetical protein [Aeribacillus composti]BBU38277.1 hypothetical protein APP_05690 [Aeribacillus pallidus]